MRSFLIAVLMLAGGMLNGEISSTSLLGTIQFSGDSATKYQVGTPISFGCKIKNLGVKPSPQGKLWIQFQYPSDLKEKPNSLLFKTEAQEIPSIAPGEQLVVQFKTTQTLPNLFDYIKNDWAMREYEAVLEVEGKEYVIGIANLTFSAYYYEAPQRQTPATVP
jgi:hypothetical protein